MAEAKLRAPLSPFPRFSTAPAMPKKKKPGDKWFDRPAGRCQLCGAGLADVVAAEQHYAGACSGLQVHRGSKTEELQCFEAEDET